MIYTVTLNPAVDRELTVSSLDFNSVLRASDYRVDCGGKGFNVSRVLKSLGVDSVAVGFAGGRSGEMLSDGLEALDIETKFIWIAGETRTNISLISLEENRYIKVNEPGPFISPEEQAGLFEMMRDIAKQDDWWVLSGSLTPGMSESIYADMIDCLQSQGAKAILDTSGASLMHGCKARPYLVKPNAHEAHILTNLPVDELSEITTAGRAIQNIGTTRVIISLGKDGAVLLDGEETWRVHSPRIEERNPIGAGDSLVGGIVWGLQAGLTLPEALTWGMAAGAATASLSGTAVGKRDLVERLHAQVKLERL
jgi:1-phosphofructokinase family hexose kinase